MTVNNNYPKPPKDTTNKDFLRLMRQALDYAMRGKINASGEFTLTASTTTTQVDDIRVNENSVILLAPQTANAAADVAAAAGVWCQCADKTFTVTHPSNANADKRFKYVIIG